MIGPLLLAQLVGFHLQQQGQGLFLMLVIDHRVDAGKLTHRGAVVVAAAHHKGNERSKRNEEISNVYHLIELFVFRFPGFHCQNGENLTQK